MLEDVTADRVSEELLRQQARRDSLTGLPNRAALIERLEDALADASEYAPAGLLILDIDDLKVVNNGLGHLMGDQLIIQMGQRFADVLAPRDLLVRTGGDEFAVLRPQPVPGDPLDDLAQRLLQSAAEPFLLDNRPVSVSVSIGAAESDASTEVPGDLLRGADIALQRAKHGGRRQSARFEPGEDKPALERMGIEELLRRSLDNEELVCLFQPITLISTGRVVAAETLVRLRDASGEIVPPSAFLPLAAELGLLGTLTDQVLRQACAAAAQWLAAGHEIRVAFNAPPQWLNATAIASVEQAIADFGIPPAIMTVEVTEEETLSAGEWPWRRSRSCAHAGCTWRSTTSAPATPGSTPSAACPRTSSRSIAPSSTRCSATTRTSSSCARCSTSSTGSASSRLPRASRRMSSWPRSGRWDASTRRASCSPVRCRSRSSRPGRCCRAGCRCSR